MIPDLTPFFADIIPAATQGLFLRHGCHGCHGDYGVT
jgi:hypothetical protein